MQFVSKEVDRTSSSRRAALANLSRSKSLSLYNEPPTTELTLDEFELFALDRLQLLREVEKCKTSGIEGADLAKRVLTKESKCVPTRPTPGAGDLEALLRKDQISHFVLRLAYCRTPELRQWFLEHEVTLFKVRFWLLH